MADRKYGRIFTVSDVEKILDVAGEFEWHKVHLDSIIATMDEEGVRFKFEPDEPTFTLRGRDKRAEGAIRFYGDHQSPRAPVHFLEGIDAAADEFRRYRDEHPEQIKEPD